MKFVSFILFLVIVSEARKVVTEQSNEPNVKGPFITSKSTQLVFEYLVHSLDPNAKLKAPMSIEVSNIRCARGSGRPNEVSCSADFNSDGKSVTKKIIKSTEFFKYLDYHYAIAVSEIMIGATHYKTESLTCRYSLEHAPYYFCSGKRDLSF